MATHWCPATGCTARIDARWLMCGEHWRLMSWEHRIAVRRAWHNWNGAGRRLGELSQAYRAARQAAIDAVNMDFDGFHWETCEGPGRGKIACWQYGRVA